APMARLKFHLQTPAQILQTLPDAEEPQAVGREQRRPRPRVPSDPVIFDAYLHLRKAPPDENQNIFGLALLDHLQQQFAHQMKEENPAIIVQGLGASIRGHLQANAASLLD